MSIVKKGKILAILDGGAGSSGKAKIGSYIFKNHEFDFACSNGSSNASHTVVIGGTTTVLKHLSSAIVIPNSVSKVYAGHGSAIDLQALKEEISIAEKNGIDVGIDYLAPIIQDIDIGYEKGTHDFEGNLLNNELQHNGTIKTGSTCSGSGSARARKIMRKSNLLLARDVDWLKPYLCNVGHDIICRLNQGESGVMEIPQGFQLSYGISDFYPNTTSRNSTIAGGFDDMMVPPSYLGDVIINFRTYPIRICSKKYIDKVTGNHLTWDQVQSNEYEYEVIDSDSGGGYQDQEEITWDQISSNVGRPVMETTTLTKLPRRVFNFSFDNMHSAIAHNMTNHTIHISINFMNYVNGEDEGVTDYLELSNKSKEWLNEIMRDINPYDNVILSYVGTGADTDDMVLLNNKTFLDENSRVTQF